MKPIPADKLEWMVKRPGDYDYRCLTYEVFDYKKSEMMGCERALWMIESDAVEDIVKSGHNRETVVEMLGFLETKCGERGTDEYFDKVIRVLQYHNNPLYSMERGSWTGETVH